LKGEELITELRDFCRLLTHEATSIESISRKVAGGRPEVLDQLRLTGKTEEEGA